LTFAGSIIDSKLRSSAAADGGRCRSHAELLRQAAEVAILGRRGRRPLLTSIRGRVGGPSGVAILGRRGRRPLLVETPTDIADPIKLRSSAAADGGRCTRS